jgi:hypothetical protein
MSISFYEDARRNGEKCHKLPLAAWVARQFEEEFGNLRSAVPALVADVRMAVELGTLTPDLGTLRWVFAGGTSALEANRHHRYIALPLDLNRQFEQLARAHGLTPNAALCMLMTWRALHGWVIPGR